MRCIRHSANVAFGTGVHGDRGFTFLFRAHGNLVFPGLQVISRERSHIGLWFRCSIRAGENRGFWCNRGLHPGEAVGFLRGCGGDPAAHRPHVCLESIHRLFAADDAVLRGRAGGNTADHPAGKAAVFSHRAFVHLAAKAAEEAAGAAFFRGEVTGRSGCRFAADYTGQTTGEGPGSCAGGAGDTTRLARDRAAAHTALFEAAKAFGRDQSLAQHIAAGMAH